MGRVKKVDLYENGTIAIVEAVSPELGNRVQRVRVQLPGTSQVQFWQNVICSAKAEAISWTMHSLDM